MKSAYSVIFYFLNTKFDSKSIYLHLPISSISEICKVRSKIMHHIPISNIFIITRQFTIFPRKKKIYKISFLTNFISPVNLSYTHSHSLSLSLYLGSLNVSSCYYVHSCLPPYVFLFI